MERIEQTIVLDRQAFDLYPLGHAKQLASLTQLASDLWHCHNKLGGMVDLEEATVFSREALVLLPAVRPDRPFA